MMRIFARSSASALRYSLSVIFMLRAIFFAIATVSALLALTDGIHFARSETLSPARSEAMSAANCLATYASMSFSHGVPMRERRSSYLPYSPKYSMFFFTDAGSLAAR